MSQSTSTGGTGLGLGTVLTIIFVVLKLTNHIDWSWWWVFSPLWIPLVLGVLVLGITVLLTVIFE
jgi:hypothetical protein